MTTTPRNHDNQLYFQSVNGWYFLLEESSSAETNSRCDVPVKSHVVSTKSISLAADKRTVKIQRNNKGLGFAVVNDRPVLVTSVENGGPAASGGLLKGDMILSVNGKERYLMPLKGKDFFTEDKHEKLFNNLKEVRAVQVTHQSPTLGDTDVISDKGLNSLHPYNPECNPSTTPEPGDGDSIRAVPKRPEGGPPRIQSDAEHPRSHGIPPGSPGTTRSVQHPPATSGTHGEFAVPVTGGA
eukprot:sb/3469091/